jgi:FkbM family methyltransferase
MIKFLKRLIKRIIFKFVKPPVHIKTIRNSYAQAGEDRIIKYIFDGVGISTPSYLEIGVYDPIECNNTFLFYQNGSRGVCVEADETLIPNIKRHRPEDKILNYGVGINDFEESEFYIFDVAGLNTFDKEEAIKRASLGTYKIVKISKVKLMSINTIIRENFKTYPDLLSIDIEGWDLKVLKTLDFNKYPIPVICVETCTYSENHIKPKELSISDFMLSKKYFIYADTYINTIFVNEQWFYNVNRNK